MKKLFDPCVNRTLELIDGQVSAVKKKAGRKPKVRVLLFLADLNLLRSLFRVLSSASSLSPPLSLGSFPPFLATALAG